MTSEGLGEMFEGDSADTCAGKFPLVSMGGRAEGLACPYPEARTPIGASGNLYAFLLSTPYNVYISIFRLNDTKIHRQKQNGLDYLGQLDTDFNTFSKHSFADSYCVRISILLPIQYITQYVGQYTSLLWDNILVLLTGRIL